MFEKITKIINRIDPIGLLSLHSPEDEYKNEIKLIYFYLKKHKNINHNDLKNEIKRIFEEAFYPQVISDNIYEIITNNILK